MWFTIWVNLIIYNYFICLVMCIYKILRNFPVATSFLLSVFFLFFYRWSIQKVKLTQKSYSKFSTPHGPHLTWPYPFLSLLICNQLAKKKKPWYKQIQYLRTTNKNINLSLSLSLNGWIWETKILNSSSIQWKVITTATRSSLFMMKMGCVLCYGV
jgi:hypothetical protein